MPATRSTRTQARRPKIVPLISRREIERRVAGLARQISADYRGKDLVMLGILKGSFIFMSDLVRKIRIPLKCAFVRASSYGAGTKSSGKVRISGFDSREVRGRHVLLVEDIIDTGLTMKKIAQSCRRRGAGDVKICALLDKPSRRLVDIQPDYLGFMVSDLFLVGYGLDLAEQYRELPVVGYGKEPKGASGAAQSMR